MSCARCIFGGPDQWASARVVDPEMFARVAEYESSFGKTVHRKLSVVQLADRGRPYQMGEADLRAARSQTFDEPAFVERWELPAGAYGEACGPS